MKLQHCAIGAGRAFALIALLSFGISNGYSQTDDPCQLAMDVDSDGVIGITDLLGLLAYFGNSDLDFDCIWDNIDPCVNGEGDCAEEMSGPCEGLAFIEYNGYDYALVEVGDDCWFAENLRTEVYANGDSIDSNDAGYWTEGGGLSHAKGYFATFGPEFTENFGLLYNWFASLDDRGLCPTSWHVASEIDWKNMELSLGMDSSEVYNEWGAFRGSISPVLKDNFWNFSTDGSFGGGNNNSGLGIRAAGFSQGYPLEWSPHIGSLAYFLTPTLTFDSELFSLNQVSWNDSIFNVAFPTYINPYNQELQLPSTFYWRELWLDRDGVRLLPGWGFGNGLEKTGMSVRCVQNQAAPGGQCDDGFIGTHFDHWPEDGRGPCYGELSIDPSGEGPCGGDFTYHYDGVDYALIELDDRCWFKENLQTRIFANGDSIPFLSSWNLADSAAMTTSDRPDALYIHEYFYNHHVGQDIRGVCPAGWSVPSMDEWESLKTAFGGNEPFVANNLTTPGWTAFTPENFNNSGGLTVLDVGHISPFGDGQYLHFSGFLNSTTSNYGPCFPFCLNMLHSSAGRSIRCIKDL